MFGGAYVSVEMERGDSEYFCVIRTSVSGQ